MAIKFSFSKKKEVFENKKPEDEIEQEILPVSHAFDVGVLVVPANEEGDEVREDVIKQAKKAELKYIRLKKASGVFAAIGAGVFAVDGTMGAIKAIKEKDVTRGIAAGIATAIGAGLCGAAGFMFADAKNDKKNFVRKYGK